MGNLTLADGHHRHFRGGRLRKIDDFTHAAASWTLTAHEARPGHELQFARMIEAGVSIPRAVFAFNSANVEGFQTRFLQWAKTLEPTPEATLIERQTILTDMLVRFSQQGKRFDHIDGFRKMLVSGGYQMEYTRNDVKWVTDSDPRIYFRTLEGRSYNSDELYFDTRSGAPLPDLVCSPVGQLQLRTRFYDLPKGAIEHETLVEGGGNGR